MKLVFSEDGIKTKLVYPNVNLRFDIDGMKIGWANSKQIELPLTERYRLNNDLVLANYKFYHEDNNKNKLKVLTVEAKLTDLVISNMRHDERALILENAMRVLINMVPDDNFTEAKTLSSKLWT